VRSSRLLLALAVSVLVVASSQASATTSPQHDFLATIARSGAALDWFGPQVDELSGFLPSREYRERGSDGPARTLSSLVVLADVRDAGPGLAWRMPHPDGPAGTPTRWDDPDAAWRTAIVHMHVDEVVAASPTPTLVQAGDDLRVSVPLDPPVTVDDIRRQLVGHRYVLFLNPDITNGDSGPPVFRVAWNDELIASVGATGHLALPAVEDGPALLARTSTLEALRRAAAEPEVTITWGVRPG
jgi:hypothetical protein